MSKLNSKIFLILLLITLVGAFFRIYKITEYPIQLNHDEVSQLYDAISIAQTGKDIYNNFLPFIFVSINDNKPPFYIYSTVFFYYIFGWQDITIKATGLIFGILMIPAVFLFTSRLFKNQQIGILAALITAVSPFEIFFSRKSFENVPGIVLMLIGFYFLFKIAKKRNLFIGLFFLGLAMYTYFSHTVIIPLFVGCFLWVYKSKMVKSSRELVAPILFWLVVISPLIFLILTHTGSSQRSKDVFIRQDPLLGKQINFNQNLNPVLNFVLTNKALVDFSFNRYLKQLDPIYIFSNGLNLTNQGPIDSGLLLFVELPFLIIGIFSLIRLKDLNKEKILILIWISLGLIPGGLTFEEFSPHRTMMVFTMLNIISAYGLYEFICWIALRRLRLLTKAIIFSSLVSLLVFNLAYFFHIYFINYAFEKSQGLQYPFKEVAKYIWSEHDNFNQIIFDPQFGEVTPVIGAAAHYYLAYYGNYPPVNFQKSYRIGQKDREVLFDKFSIRKIDWLSDNKLTNVLVIGSPWSIPIRLVPKEKIVKTFYYYDHEIAFYAIKL